MLSSGSLSDRFGASRALAGGLIGFTVASVACGLATSLPVLLSARLAQGVTAALMLPASLALVRQAYMDAGERSRAIAIWTAGGGAAIAGGPVIGGLLVSSVGWQASFFLNLPIGVLGVLALTRLPPSPRRRSHLDLPGQACAAVAASGLVLGVIQADTEGLGSPVTLAALAAFIVAACLFVVVERRVAVPMVPLDLFHSATISASTVTGLVLNLATYGEIFVLSLFFQQSLHQSPAAAGAMFLPMTGLVTGMNLLAGRLTRRHGPRLPLLAGQLILASGLLGLLAVGPRTSITAVEILVPPLGVGAGLTIPPLTTAFMNATRPDQAGIGSGVLNAARQVGTALGVAAGLILATIVLTLRHVQPTPRHQAAFQSQGLGIHDTSCVEPACR